MTVMIEPGLLAGAVTPPPSKSQAHRLLIARALAGENLDDPAHRADSQDIRATRDCLKSLREGEGELPVLECGESGSTLRFLIPVALALRGGGVFRGRGRLMDRPQEPYFRIFDGMGITHRREGDSLTVWGRLRPGEYPMPGDVSSQFVTGLLFALPLLEGESIIRLTSPLESRGYVDMTLQVLRDRGIRVEELPEGNSATGGSVYRGSVLPTMYKKLIENSLDILYDKLQESRDKQLVVGVSSYLMLAVYKMFRLLYEASPKNVSGMFRVGSARWDRSADAAMSMAEGDLAAALTGEDGTRDSLEPATLALSTDQLARDYPRHATSLFNLVKNAEEAMRGLKKAE